MKKSLGDNRMTTLAALWTAMFVVNENIILILPLLPFLRSAFRLSDAESATLLIAYPVLAFAAMRFTASARTRRPVAPA